VPDPRLLRIVEQLRASRFADLKGARASLSFPVPERLLNEFVSALLPPSAPVRDVTVRPQAANRSCAWVAMAFPDSSAAERERIAIGMWDNLARTVFEYTQLDRLWTGDPATNRVSMDAATVQACRDIWESNRPTMGFSLHLANWELAAISIPRHGWKALIPYRRAKNQALTRNAAPPIEAAWRRL
jgi:hypothetical protein